MHKQKLYFLLKPASTGIYAIIRYQKCANDKNGPRITVRYFLKESIFQHHILPLKVMTALSKDKLKEFSMPSKECLFLYAPGLGIIARWGPLPVSMVLRSEESLNIGDAESGADI